MVRTRRTIVKSEQDARETSQSQSTPAEALIAQPKEVKETRKIKIKLTRKPDPEDPTQLPPHSAEISSDLQPEVPEPPKKRIKIILKHKAALDGLPPLQIPSSADSEAQPNEVQEPASLARGMTLRKRTLPVPSPSARTPKTGKPNAAAPKSSTAKPKTAASKPTAPKRTREAVDVAVKEPKRPKPIATQNSHVSGDLKGKLYTWWDPTKPNIAHYWYEAEPCPQRKHFVAPLESQGHKVQFYPRDSSRAKSTAPSRSYTAKWKVDVRQPVPAGMASVPRPRRRFIYRVRGLGRVQRPPVNPRTSCQVICRASPCEDENEPLLPRAAEGHKVEYFPNGEGPFQDPPTDSRSACRLVWTVPGTETVARVTR
jgi:hypothetical protein